MVVASRLPIIATPGYLLFLMLLCAIPLHAAKTPASDELVTIQSQESSVRTDGSVKRVDVALFSHGELGGWEERSFKGGTSYRLWKDAVKGQVLRAQSNATASAIGKRVQIDLTKTPYLNWSWKIDSQLEGINEAARSGDDFAARIYVVKKAGIFGRNSKAVNYVWSSNQSKGALWDNAFKPNNSKMIAVRGVEHVVDQWAMEKRNVANDFKRLYGADIQTVDLLAIMTDTDNTGLSVSASYGDIFFSSE